MEFTEIVTYRVYGAHYELTKPGINGDEGTTITFDTPVVSGAESGMLEGFITEMDGVALRTAAAIGTGLTVKRTYLVTGEYDPAPVTLT